MARQSIAEALEKLPDHFLQVQRSYIVNFNKVATISTEELRIGSTTIPIGHQFKADLLRKLKQS